MNTNISTLRAMQLAVVAAGAVMASAAALAAATPEVTVEAARQAKVEVIERSASGVTTQLITLTRRVSYRDLNLTIVAGENELTKRVNDTAKAACKELDDLYPLTRSPAESAACVKKATDDAMVQVRAAITAAGARKN
jgi:UrcA family protein